MVFRWPLRRSNPLNVPYRLCYTKCEIQVELAVNVTGKNTNTLLGQIREDVGAHAKLTRH